MNDQQGILTVRQPKYVFWLSIIFPIGFILMPIFVHIFQSQNEVIIFLYLMCGSLALITALLFLLTAKVWLVTVEDNNIKFRNIFGKVKVIPLKSIRKVQQRSNISNHGVLLELVLYTYEGKKFLSLTSDFVGFDDFHNRLKQESMEFK